MIVNHLRIDLDLDNDAFADSDAGPEIARILYGLAERVQQRSRGELADVEMALRDINGNRVGSARFEVADVGVHRDEFEDTVPVGHPIVTSVPREVREGVYALTWNTLFRVLEDGCDTEVRGYERHNVLAETLLAHIANGRISANEVWRMAAKYFPSSSDTIDK